MATPPKDLVDLQPPKDLVDLTPPEDLAALPADRSIPTDVAEHLASGKPSPAPYEPTLKEKALDALESVVENSIALGPAGELPSMGAEGIAYGLSKAPALLDEYNLATQAASKGINALKTSAKENVVAPIAEKLQPLVNLAKAAPGEVASYFSNGVPAEAFRNLWNITREADPTLSGMYKEGKEFKLPEYAEAIYNYARKFGLPHDWALKAEHMNSEAEDMGVWYLKKEYAKESKIPVKEQESYFAKWKEATPEQKERLAKQTGADFSKWGMEPRKTNEKFNISDLYKLATQAPGWPTGLLSGFKSPRVAAKATETAANVANYLERIPAALKEISLPQKAAGAANLYGPEENKADGGLLKKFKKK